MAEAEGSSEQDDVSFLRTVSRNETKKLMQVTISILSIDSSRSLQESKSFEQNRKSMLINRL
jgi:hypothetical protein